MTNWAAPRARSPIRARVEIPGSKSLTNRLLILAALADGSSRITAALRARDTLLMADALRSLGVRIDDDGDDWVVTPGALHGADVDTGLAGTVMRFVPPVAALAQGKVRFDGDEYARERPMTTLLDGMRQLGIEVDDESRGRLPFTVVGAGSVPGGTVSIDASASSQFVSGLLLAAARFEAGAEVRHSGAVAVPSMPHIEMTLEVLRTAGVGVASPEPGVWQVDPGPIAARDWMVEPDLSNAAPFLAAALVTGGSVTIPRWPDSTTQPGDQLRELLARMGADVQLTDAGLTVSAGDGLHGLVADLHDVGELTPTLVALAALAESPSQLTGIGHLRGHETDRLAALVAELSGLGGTIAADDDGLSITPSPLRGGVWHSYADHRMATAGAVLGLAVDGVEVEDVESTTKTLPDFTGMWNAMIGHGA